MAVSRDLLAAVQELIALTKSPDIAEVEKAVAQLAEMAEVDSQLGYCWLTIGSGS